MKVLITEEQLKLIINEENDDVKLSKVEQQFLQNYIPIPREQIAAYEQLKNRLKSNEISVRHKEFFKQYPFHTDQMKKLRDKGGKFTNDVQPYDFSELTSGVVAHNQSINRGEDKKWSKGEGKKYLKQKSDKYSKMTPGRLKSSYDNDLELDELKNLERLVDVIIHLKNMGVPISEITAGDDYYHRYTKGGLHPNGMAIDFILSKSSPDIQKKLEEAVAVLITRHPDLAEKFSFINEYYAETSAGTGKHIHIGYGNNSKVYYQWLTDKNGKRIGNWEQHNVANKKILENPKYTELSVDLDVTGAGNEKEDNVENLEPLKIIGFNLKTGIMSIDFGGITSGVVFSLFKKDKNGKFIPEPQFATQKGGAIPNSLRIGPKTSLMYDNPQVKHYQVLGQIPYYNNWEKNYGEKVDGFLPITGNEALKFEISRQIDERLVGTKTSTEEFYVNENGEMSKNKFIVNNEETSVDSLKCKPKGVRIVKPMTIVTPTNPNGLPYDDWDWCDARTKGDAYMGTTIYVDSKGREVVVNNSY